jgi:2,4-dienoyl-CoA reductase-like NADH-dependent reductase (Old Yellow Enzyme family)
MKNKNLTKEYKLSENLALQNRIVMAPMNRSLGQESGVITEDGIKYYERRADAGLLIIEATNISPLARGYPDSHGIFTSEQISKWKEFNERVHTKGAKTFSQLFHSGRISHEIYHGNQPVAPSAVEYVGRIHRTDNLQYGTPRALETNEIEDIVKDFVQAARNAIEGGFDGIEIHGANGYLLDQFLHKETNKRTDRYGGSVENMARVVLEVVDAVVEAVGRDKVGIRLSPHAYLNLGYTRGDEDIFIYLLKELTKRNILYLHTGIFDDHEVVDYLGGKVSEFCRRYYDGTLIVNGSYSVSEAEESIGSGKSDLVAFGRNFIANPDLVSKIKDNHKLNEYDNSMLERLE